MISVIIPTLNEEKIIRKTLFDLERQKGHFETIVVDGGSEDKTINMVKEFKWVKPFIYKKGRNKQMNYGARESKGDILLFLHADTTLPENFQRLVEKAIKEGYEGGVFYRVFNEANYLLKMIVFSVNLLSSSLKIYFGDQAIFVKKELFEKLGGFPDIEIFEDCGFCRRWRNYKIKTIKNPVITSSRRFSNNGVLRTFMLMQWITIAYLLGFNPNRMKKYYRDVR